MTGPLPPSVRRGYAAGSVATGAFGTVPGLLLLPYLTDVVGIGAAIAGLIVFLPKAWDVVIDPFVGRISDRAADRRGRRPFLLWGGLLLAIAFALLFAGPTGVPALSGVYVVVLFVACATAFTFFQVPFMAMPAEMTDDYDERTRLMTWRVVVLALAILVSGGVAPMLVNAFGGEPTADGYRVMGVFVGLLIVAGALGAYLGTARAPERRRPAAAGSIAEQLRIIVQVADFRSLLLTFVVQALGIGALLAAVAYGAKDLLDSSLAATLLFVAFVGPALVVTPFWERVAARRDKRHGYVLASVTMIVGMLALLVAHTGSLVLTCLAAGVAGIGYAGAQVFPLAMLPDVAGRDAERSEENRIGVFAGLWTAGETLGMALGPAIFALVLAIGGYLSSTEGEVVVQDDGTRLAIALGFSVLPALLVAVSLFFLRHYRHDSEREEVAREHR
ncbi:MFS transporter [Aeromicrobium phragmitis]|uniref:MFS transporter n=1 Tax=Aeromicrobium phragmitis TaxID=2478914 RepID=A0A3L8PND1_9ACTN|nr:MFS transporter [Aeromicrobium phragmitis]RLV56299.1 MFS transporter [Aeromicrobium phragmitis]